MLGIEAEKANQIDQSKVALEKYLCLCSAKRSIYFTKNFQLKR